MRIITRQLRNGLASKHRTAMKTNLWQASWYKTKRTQHPHEFNSGPQKINACIITIKTLNQELKTEQSNV